MKIEDIKNELILSCITGDSKRFIPFLLSKNVKTEMPNKIRFYSFFKHMIECSKQNSIGKWTLRIEEASWHDKQNTLAYNFYDEKHKYARLSIMVTEQNDKLILDTMPF